MPGADAYVASARSYALALEQSESRPAAAYLLLISSIEALANEAYRDVRPPETERIEAKKDVCRLAVEMSLTEEQGGRLSLEASKDMSWSSWKFRTFIQEHVAEDVWERADDLFEVPQAYLPHRDDFRQTIKAIYSARGKALHAGETNRASAGFVAGPWIPVRALHELLSGQATVPPVPWFERIVCSALTAYARKRGKPPPADSEA
jgi:hypothetical protein